MVGIIQERVHALVVGLGEKEGLVLADEVDGVESLAAVHAALEVGDEVGGVAFAPVAFESFHGLSEGVDGIDAYRTGVVYSEDEGDLALVAQVVVDGGITLLLRVGGQEVGNVFLVVETQGREDAEDRQHQQQRYREGLVLRQVVIDRKEEPVHVPRLLNSL